MTTITLSAVKVNYLVNLDQFTTLPIFFCHKATIVHSSKQDSKLLSQNLYHCAKQLEIDIVVPPVQVPQ